MSSEIGQAYVRIRPNVSGFKGETERGVRSAFGGIARIAAPLIGAATAFEFGKKALSAAAQEDAALRSVRKSVLDTDKAWIQHGQNVGAILSGEARDAGFGLGEVSQAFLRLETGTKSTSTSLRLLGEAEDVARGRHIDLAQAAGLLSRAQQGSTTGFRRLGIIIPPVTTNVSKLVLQHAELAKAGVKFDATSKQQYASSLANAKALDAQATKAKVLAEVQARFSGQSKTFAAGPAGEFARLRENITQFEASIGRDLLPTLNTGVEDVRQWVDELRTSDSVHRTVANGVHVFAAAVNAGKQAVEFFIPPLRTVAGVIAHVGGFAGFGGIAAFAAGFKAVSFAASVASSVQQRYQAVVRAGAAGDSGRAAILGREAAAYNGLSVAVERNALALDSNIISQTGGAASIERGLLPQVANVSQVVQATADTSRAASADIAAATGEFASSAASAGESALSTADSIASVSDHSVALAKDLGLATRNVTILGREFAVARVGAGTFAAGLTAVQTAQLAQAGVTAEQVAALDRYLIATQSTLGAQRAQAIATEAQTASLAGNVGALHADTEALLANRAANIGAAEGAAASAAANTVATTERAATAAGGLATTLGRVGRGLFTLAGGYRTVAAVGLAAFAFGIYKGVTAESGLEQATHRLDSSLDELSQRLGIAQGHAHAYATAISDIKSDKVAVEVAKANVALAKQALVTTSAKSGSAEYLSLTTQVASAQDSLRRAEEGLGAARRSASSLARKRREDEDLIREATEKSIARINEQRIAAGVAHEGEAPPAEIARLRARLGITAVQARVQAGLNRGTLDFAAALQKEAESNKSGPLRTRIGLIEGLTTALGKVPPQEEIRLILTSNAKQGLAEIIGELEKARPKAEGFANALRQERFAVQGSNPALARRIGLIIEFTREIGRVPTKREVNIALKTPKLNDAVTALAKILSQMDGAAARAGFASGKDFSKNFIQSLLASGVLTALNGLLSQAGSIAGAAARKAADVGKGELQTARNAISDTQKSIKTINETIRTARTDLAAAQRTLADANRDVADAIRQGSQSIRDSVTQAGQNLFSIGSGLSDAVDQFLDATAKTQDALAGPPAKEAQRLRNSIASGEAGPDIARRAQALASQLEQQQIVEKDSLDKQKKRSRQQIADLVDQFNKGTISISTFNKRLAGVLAADGFSYGKAGHVLGVAFADGFRAQVQGIRAQARAITQGGRLPGIGALSPSVVHPLEAIKQSQRDIADAQRRRDDARLDVQKDTRHLDRLEESHQRLILTESRAQHRLQRLMEQHLRFIRGQAKAQTNLLRAREATGEGHRQPRRRPQPTATGGARLGAIAGGG